MRIFILISLYITLLGAHSSLTPLPQPTPQDSHKVDLGKQLFFDPLLSSEGTYSCASCHNFALGGGDGKAVAVGVNDYIGELNTPSIFNVSLNMTLGWFSSSHTVKKSAKIAFLNPLEMNGDINKTIAYLHATTSYKQLFEQGYGSVTEEAIFDAIDIYVSTLLTPGPFDRYLRDDTDAITAQAKRGMELFIHKGCVSCHNGVNVGGQMFQRFGVFDEQMINRSSHLGRYTVTKKEKDRYVFRVPPLRNVTETAPYFHDGSVPTLREAILLMSQHQLGSSLEVGEVNAIEAFLETLSGDVTDEK